LNGGIFGSRQDRAYVAGMDLKLWQKALRDAERELEAATTRMTLDAAAKRLMRAKAELKRLQAEISA
jgi:beta-glucosidase-like glycosyl hydrolase